MIKDNNNDRSTTWAFIVYPESAPDDWKQILKYSYVRFAVSPLHAPDLCKTGQEQERKPHYHVMIVFDSLKSYKQVECITNWINSTRPFIVHNPSGLYRYMIHLDDPNKQQFKNGFDEIEKFNGFDGDKYEGYSEKELDSIYKEIFNFIDDNDITEYSKLIQLCKNDELDISNCFRFVRKNSVLFSLYINSRRNYKHDLTAKSFEERLKILEELIRCK